MLFAESSYITPPHIARLESQGERGDRILIQGKTTGSAMVAVRLVDPAYRVRKFWKLPRKEFARARQGKLAIVVCDVLLQVVLQECLRVLNLLVVWYSLLSVSFSLNSH